MRGESQVGKAQLVASLNGLNAAADHAMVQRTRRRVYMAAAAEREGRMVQRRHIGIAILVATALFVLLTPALWSGVDDVLGGELLLDMPGMIAAFVLTLFAGVAAVLFLLSWRSQQQIRR